MIGTAVIAFTLAGMAVLPSGSLTPLYSAGHMEKVSVHRFALDREPVTRAEYLDFLRTNPAWRRSAVTAAKADKGYLAEWGSDLNAGSGTQLRWPVTEVSRLAASAYCESKGKRLPTVEEWEYAASADRSRRDATREKTFISRLIGLYTSRAATRSTEIGKSSSNVYGVRDLHELVWEMTAEMSGHQHHMFCASSAIGASNPENYPAFMRYAVRSGIQGRTTTQKNLGFRCAADIA